MAPSTPTVIMTHPVIQGVMRVWPAAVEEWEESGWEVDDDYEPEPPPGSTHVTRDELAEAIADVEGGGLADGAVTNAKVASGAAISADKLADGTGKKVLTAAERTKLAGLPFDGSNTDLGDAAVGALFAATHVTGGVADEFGLGAGPTRDAQTAAWDVNRGLWKPTTRKSLVVDRAIPNGIVDHRVVWVDSTGANLYAIGTDFLCGQRRPVGGRDMAAKLCIEPGCLDFGSPRCPSCTAARRPSLSLRRQRNAERDARRGTTAQRGYGADHRRRRARLLPLAIGQLCPLCGEVMAEGQPLNLHHTVARAHGGEHGDAIVHRWCDQAEGGRTRRRPS